MSCLTRASNRNPLTYPEPEVPDKKTPDGGSLISALDLPMLLGDLVEGVITINQEGQIEGFNPAAERLFGYRAEEVIGKSVDTLMPTSRTKGHEQYLADYRGRGKSEVIGHVRELPARAKDGSELTIELGLSRIKLEDQEFFLGTVRDAARRQPIEQRIRDLARFPDENPNPVLRINFDGQILYFNKPGKKLIDQWQTGLNKPAPEWLINFVNKGLHDGGTIETEIAIKSQYFVLVLAPVMEENYVNLYAQDITKRKIAEEELRKHRDQLEGLVKERTEDLAIARDEALAANRAKSSFLANMSHELRTPLNAIIGYSEMMIEDSKQHGKEDHADDLGQIRKAGKHLLSLISDILDLSKIEAGRMTLRVEDIDIAMLINDVCSTVLPLMQANNNELLVDISDAGGIKSDATRLKQVLYNLLSNAAKFTSDGQVKLIVERKDNNGGWIWITVEDTGIGLSDEQIDTIFEPFTQADNSVSHKFGGTGLGLTISREFCRMMGGDITVASQQARGSKFVVQLPVRGKAVNNSH